MGLDEILDKIQINKFNIFMGLLSTSQFATSISCFAYEINNYLKEGFDENSAIRILAGSSTLLLSYIGGKPVPWAVKQQNQRYERLIECLEKKGYKEEFCQLYMDHPCGRSVVKAALKRTGNFEHYAELKDKFPLTGLA